MKRYAWYLVILGTALSACDPYEEPTLRPLPPLERATPEARLGLPEVEGEWRFVGWEVPNAEAMNGLARPGELWIEAQRLDSVAGFYLTGGERLPLVGEVRRDSVVSLVTLAPAEERRFLAGRVSRDTLWVDLTSFPFFATWPRGTRGAYVRQPVNVPFVRLPDGTLLRDTVEEPPAPAPEPEPAASPPAPRQTGPRLLGRPVEPPPRETPAPREPPDTASPGAPEAPDRS